MIFNMTGGIPLNFKVKAYASADLLPAYAAENTIAVITETPISGYVFSGTDPEAPEEGTVWIRTMSDQSSFEFNALKKNAIVISTISAKQYINGSWAGVVIKLYQSGQWIGTQLTLFDGGNTAKLWEKDTTLRLGATTAQYWNRGNVSIGETIVLTNSNLTDIACASTVNKYNLRSYTEIRIDLNLNPSYLDRLYIYENSGAVLDTDPVAIIQLHNGMNAVPIPDGVDATKSYKLGIAMSGEPNASRLEIKSVELW